MSGPAGMIDYTRAMTAGKRWPIPTEGSNYVAIIKAPAGGLLLKFDDRAEIERYEGMGTPVPEFRNLVLISNVDQEVTISIGYVESGAPYDSRPVQFFGNIDVNTDVPSTNTSLEDATVLPGAKVEMVPQDLNRKTTLLTLDQAAPDFVRYGDSLISATRGLKLYPGDTIAIDGTAPLHVLNTNAVPVLLNRMTQAR